MNKMKSNCVMDFELLWFKWLFALQVMGLRRQKNYAGRWDILIQQATQCLNRLIEIAARKRRNYILDQVLPPHPQSALIVATVVNVP